jgi:hypothetical protein
MKLNEKQNPEPSSDELPQIAGSKDLELYRVVSDVVRIDLRRRGFAIGTYYVTTVGFAVVQREHTGEQFDAILESALIHNDDTYVEPGDRVIAYAELHRPDRHHLHITASLKPGQQPTVHHARRIVGFGLT